jgi:hypothetical protein
MRIVRVKRVGEGLHPNEVIVAVTTTDGTEELVVHKRSLGTGDTLLIGYPIGGDDKNNLLIELPRETVRGSSRVWVPASTVEDAAA